jgi:5'-nucleotidase
MRFLIDMDGVLADWETRFLDLWRERHPGRPYVSIPERRSFYVTSDYPRELYPHVRSIYLAPGFYRTLPPIEGGIEALHEMDRLGHRVSLCSSPLTDFQNCVLEKYEWVAEHLGPDWIPRLVLTKDKTLVRADILVDDRPEVEGAETPEWEHVVFDQPYNRHVTDRRRITWETWRSLLPDGEDA